MSNGATTDYSGNYIYEDDHIEEGSELEFFSHAEGYVSPKSSGGYDYVYQYKDHLGNVRLSYMDADNNGRVTTAEVIEESNYYPFGLKHMGYGPTTSSLGNSVAQRWKYNGKEYDESLDINTYDFGARNYDPALGRWMNMDPLAEKYLSISPYVSNINNPISFIDPTGEDIRFYMWEYSYVDDKWTRKEVEFDELDKKVQKGLEAFAETELGKGFFGKFAKKGDKIGNVEFDKDGEYSNHDIEYSEFTSSGSAYGMSPPMEGENNIVFTMGINTGRNSDDQNVESMSITNGHEAFIHMIQYMDELIEAYENGDNEKVKRIIQNESNGTKRNPQDHQGYIGKDDRYNTFRMFLSQLKSVLNPVNVNRQIKRHDSKFKDKGQRRERY